MTPGGRGNIDKVLLSFRLPGIWLWRLPLAVLCTHGVFVPEPPNCEGFSDRLCAVAGSERPALWPRPQYAPPSPARRLVRRRA